MGRPAVARQGRLSGSVVQAVGGSAGAEGEADMTITVGSSDVAAILGLSPWRQPVEVWAQLTGLLPRYSEEDTAGQRRGRILEPALIAHYERTRGLRLSPGPPISAEPIVAADGWRSCRPDATGPGLVVEAKSTRRWDGWGADGTDKIPVHYAAQVAWQLSVIGADRGALIAYCPMDDDVRVYEIVRNRSLEERLVARVRAWMEAHVWAAEPVQPAPLPMELVSARHASGGGEDAAILEPDAFDLAVARRLADVRAATKSLSAEEDRLRAQLCARIGDARGLRGIASWSAQEGRETVDVKRLRVDWPDVAKQVAATGKPSRRFTFTFDAEDS